MYWTIFEGDSIGGPDSSKCIWSGETAPRIITTSRASQICRINLVPIFRTPDHVILQIEYRVRAMPVFRHSLIVEAVERAAKS